MVEVRGRTQDATTVRETVATWLAANWDAGTPVETFRERLADSGWAVPTWPVEYYGRGLSPDLARAVADEFVRAGAPGANMSPPHGIWLAAPAILEHGTHDQKRHFLRRMITAEDRWCQLFSEPGSGSDLAGLQTTAVLHGDEWIVNGQKVWTSSAGMANIGIMPARTDWDAPKHQGITWFAMPMDQPGVEVRPLRQMNGGAEFCEVFFTDARAPAFNAIGGVNDGWKATVTTLMHERVAMPVVPGAAMFGARARPARPDDDGAEDPARIAMAMRGAGGWRWMAHLARQAGRDRDPVVRQRIAGLYVLGEVGRLNAERAMAASRAGRPPGPEGSLAKLSQSAISRSTRDLGMALLGAAGMVTGPDAPFDGAVQGQCLSSPSTSIAGGTDEIQRNIVGERVLGLPKEPRADAGLPFREVLQNVTRWRTT